MVYLPLWKISNSVGIIIRKMFQVASESPGYLQKKTKE